jgi:hypothetical protein
VNTVVAGVTGSWKTTVTGAALAALHVSVNGVSPKQLVFAALLAFLGALAQDHKAS